MRSSSLVLVLSVVLGGCVLHAQAFDFFTDMIANPIGALSESLFKWNPFKDEFNPIKVLVSNLDEFDPNSTLVKRNYHYGCNCTNLTCTCCSHIEVNLLKMNRTGCLNATYFSDDLNLRLTYDLDRRVMYHSMISITNPPDMCFGDPMSMGNLCIKLYQLDARNKSLAGCVDTAPKVAGRELQRIRLGCFRMSNSSSYTEKKLVVVQSNRKKTVYAYDNMATSTMSTMPTKLEDFGKEIIYMTYSNLLDSLKELNLSAFTGDFKPIKFVSELYKTFFTDQQSSQQ